MVFFRKYDLIILEDFIHLQVVLNSLIKSCNCVIFIWGEKMKIAICDDEKLYIERVEKIVSSFFESEETQAEIETFPSGEKLVEAESLFDIVFLDIEMSGLNGIETAKILNQKNSKAKIFIFTSHNHYLDDAMDLNVFRYIDKSSSDERIVAGLKKSIESLRHTEIYITTKNNEKLRIPKNDIVFVEVKYKKVYVQTVNEQYMVRDKFEYYKEKLNDSFFAVPHSSFIINFSHVSKYKRENVELTGGFKITIAPKRQAEFRKLWFDYLKGE